MKTVLSVLMSVVLLSALSCGTGVSNIDEIQNRVNRNKCRINRDNLIFEIQGLEYNLDTLFTEIPSDLLADSLLVCPADGEPYVMATDGDKREIQCTFCREHSSF